MIMVNRPSAAIRVGLWALPLYGALTAWATLDAQPDQVTDPEGWARFVSTNYYLLSHLVGSTGGTILAILGTMALGGYLASGRSAKLGVPAMAVAVAGHALLLVPAAISTFALPAIGRTYLGGVHRRHADRLLAGNGGHVPAWTAARAGRERPSRSGHVALRPVAEVGGRRLGNRSACVLRPWRRARPGYHRCEPTNSDCGRPVDRDQRRLDRLGCPTLDPRAGPIHRRIGREQSSGAQRQHRRSLIAEKRSAGGRACHLTGEIFGKVARDTMSGNQLCQRRLLDPADLLCLPASGVEPASRRRIDRARDVTTQPDPFALVPAPGIRHGHRGHQGNCVGMHGGAV